MTSPLSPPNLNHAFDAYKAGETVEKCAAIAGISIPTFRNRLRDAGLPLRRRSSDDGDLQRAIDSYIAGQTVAQAAEAVGIGRETLRQNLIKRGIPLRGRDDAARSRRTPTPDGLVDDFLSGTSVKALSRKHGVDRNAIYRMLREAGVNGRDRSTAMTIRWQRATQEQRDAMLTAAHEAARQPQTVEQRIRIAASKAGRPFSDDEVELAGFLRERGHTVELGVPLGKYNLDLVVAGTVAVEVFGGQWHASGRHRERFSERSRHILDSGYSLAIIWVQKPGYPIGVACVQHLCSLVQITRGHPSIRRQHWVIRGDGYFLAAREDDGDEVPFIHASGRRDG